MLECLSVLEVCAYGVPSKKRKIYLTADYWSARAYACKRGGETIHNAILAIDDLGRLFSDKKLRNSHADGLQSELDQGESEDRGTIMQQIANLNNEHLLDLSKRQLKEISARLKPLAADGYPVVYAIKGDRRWFNGPRFAYRVETLPVTRVPVSRLKARADFRNGIQCMYMHTLMPKPLHWKPLPYLEYIGKNRDEYPFRNHIEWLQRTSNAAIRDRWVQVRGTV